MGESGQARRFCEPGDGFSGKCLGRLVPTENQFGVGDGFFGRHIPSIEGIRERDQHEADTDCHGVFSDVFGEEFEAGVTRLLCHGKASLRKGVKESEKSEDREKKDGGEFREFGESEEKTCENDVLPTWTLEKVKEEIESEEEKSRDTDIGSHVVSVSDRIRVEDKEGDGDESGERPSEFTSPKEEKKPEEESDESDRKA